MMQIAMMTSYNLIILVFIALSSLLAYTIVLSIRGIRKSRNNKRVLWILGLITLVPFALADVFAWFILFLSYYPHYSFDKIDWSSNVEQRYKMADDLVDSQRLIGLTRAQAIDLLGKPYREWDNIDHTIRYDIGDRPTIVMDLDPDELVLEVKDGKVVKSYLHET
ncbi:hypothetical protein [Hymenobacter negativus]|uniref:Outer membrane protein assembly factor BamE n=1 Tax=Hymenobacter negativus TaxID=2795026 RepID=A0ABS0Q609_9BACT|nr:hypothetical protein [Hymenobacter negativus]MBH8557808.1 hypothetical protein [Hymenobacter negativus]